MKRLLRLLRAAPLYVGAWMPMIVTNAALLRRAEIAPNWTVAFIFASVYFAPAMLLSVPVIALARHLVDRGFAPLSWPSLGAHITTAVAFSWLWLGMFYGYLWLVGGGSLVQQVAGHDAWAWEFVQSLFVYGLVAGFAAAVRTSQRLREQAVAAARSDVLRVRAEMQALRGQLDPHFLFNTLHSITALVRADPPQAEEALVQFGALLRRVLDWKRDGTDELTLAEEMEFVEGCLALEKLRLGDRLRVEQAIAPEALACYVPVFSVQPLVENAIRHAIAPQRGGGVITITANMARDKLTITVADAGPGADPAAVAGANGTGLGAIRQRLQLRHGDEARLQVDTAPGRGFAVTLELPAVTEPVFNAVE